MARIAGINIPLNKRVEVGLTYIYGIGRPMSNELLKQAGISPDTYVRDR
jgi:small subunit ribosomal protein S13